MNNTQIIELRHYGYPHIMKWIINVIQVIPSCALQALQNSSEALAKQEASGRATLNANQ